MWGCLMIGDDFNYYETAVKQLFISVIHQHFLSLPLSHHNTDVAAGYMK